MVSVLKRIRLNKLTREKTVIAPARTSRPHVAGARACPFCPGREHETPPAHLTVVLIEGTPVIVYEDSSPWIVRVFDNKYPSFSKEFDVEEGYGYHEVIVESSRHVVDPFEVPRDEYKWALRAAMERIDEIFKDENIVHALWFKNRGPRSGASIEHIHSQLIATSEEIPLISMEEEVFRENSCPLCEEPPSERVVYVTDNIIVFTPEAPRADYEVWIAPLKHQASISSSQYDVIDDVAEAIRRVTYAYVKCLNIDSYNIWLHFSRFSKFHWHLEAMPLKEPWGGMERGGRFYVVTVSPEEASKVIKTCIEAANI